MGDLFQGTCYISLHRCSGNWTVGWRGCDKRLPWIYKCYAINGNHNWVVFRLATILQYCYQVQDCIARASPLWHHGAAVFTFVFVICHYDAKMTLDECLVFKIVELHAAVGRKQYNVSTVHVITCIILCTTCFNHVRSITSVLPNAVMCIIWDIMPFLQHLIIKYFARYDDEFWFMLTEFFFKLLYFDMPCESAVFSVKFSNRFCCQSC